MSTFFIVIHGPTGVGKTDFILNLGTLFPIEIINCDSGQMYEPFTIGTAKPNWKKEKIPHHLFDIVTTPTDYSVVEYRKQVQNLLEEIGKRKAIPVLVGGSGFYGKSLFFPPLEGDYMVVPKSGSWDDLQKLDPDRAVHIHKNDTYRINRALTIIESLKGKASLQKPIFNPIGTNYLVVYLFKERSLIYEQINNRTHTMIENGWIDEVSRIKDTQWEDFLKSKKLIGYREIIHYLDGNGDKETLIKTIAQKTRNYAKRQETFWRMLKRSLEPYSNSNSIMECNLTQEKEIAALYKVIQQRSKAYY